MIRFERKRKRRKSSSISSLTHTTNILYDKRASGKKCLDILSCHSPDNVDKVEFFLHHLSLGVIILNGLQT